MSNQTTTINPDGESSEQYLIGYIALALSCTGFGTMFVPLKSIQPKDGFFVQWVECSVVLVTGFIINAIRGFPDFQWIAAIGGALYATGNVFSVPIVNGIGMSLGLLIWGSMQIMVGWSVARFGLFNWLSATHVEHDLLNYLGLALTIISGILFVFIRHTKEEQHDNSYELKPETVQEVSNTKAFSRKVPFILMAMILAVFHGLMMTPIDILKQKYPSNDTYKVFDYCWSFYSSVFVFSTIYFFLYCVVLQRKAYVERELIIPSIFYGILWTTGMTFWFLSSDKLSQVVAYPITTRLPAIISALIDIILFRSIRGKHNIIFLAFAIVVGLSGVVLIALSNQKL
ncbi:unnamed protein product [Auanema sp. JU1783]|nr:unnamed protein product [Auanema sp. JU1783]